MGRNAYGTKERKYQKGLQKDKQKEIHYQLEIKNGIKSIVLVMQYLMLKIIEYR